MDEEVRRPGWRQYGCDLADKSKRPASDAYYKLLCEVKALIEEEMLRLRPEEPAAEEPVPPIPEKIADHTHRGKGL